MSRYRVCILIALLFLLIGYFAHKPALRLYYRVDHLSLIQKAAQKNSVSPYLVASVIFTESRFRSQAQSEAGAVGLMQLMPETALDLAARHRQLDFSLSRLAEPELNINLGTAYLSDLEGRFPNIEFALAAYNAGPTLAQEWLEHGKYIAYPETRHFVKSVLRHQRRLRYLFPEWSSYPKAVKQGQ